MEGRSISTSSKYNIAVVRNSQFWQDKIILKHKLWILTQWFMWQINLFWWGCLYTVAWMIYKALHQLHWLFGDTAVKMWRRTATDVCHKVVVFKSNYAHNGPKVFNVTGKCQAVSSYAFIKYENNTCCNVLFYVEHPKATSGARLQTHAQGKAAFLPCRQISFY